MVEAQQYDRPLSRGMSVGLLFTSIAWTGLSIALVIVALRAESLQKIYYASKIIWAAGALMVLLGGAGAWVATDELAGGRKTALLVAAVWIWSIAGFAAAGGLAIHRMHHWPLPEIAVGAVLAAVITVLIAFRNPRDKRGAL